MIVAATPEVRAALLAIPPGPDEQIAEADGALYWTVPKGDTLTSPIGVAQGSAHHKPWVTTRNLNTLEKLFR